MAAIYVRSTDGSDSDDGSTWALAKASLAGAAAIDAAGDTIFVSDAHSETTAAAVTLAFAGTAASPTKVVCGDDAAEPPTSVSTAAVMATTGSSNITTTGDVYIRGVQFKPGNATNNASMLIANASVATSQTFDQCQFSLGGSSNSAAVQVGNTGATVGIDIRWEQCGVQFAAALQKIRIANARFTWDGGSLLSGGTSPIYLIEAGNNGRGASRSTISGIDLSSASAGMHLVGAISGPGHVTFRDCQLPASWSGSLVSATLVQGFRAELHNCDSGDTNYRLWIEDYTGSIKQDTGVYLDGGVTDGTTPLSYKFASSANCNFLSGRLYGPEMHVWNDTTGSSKTVTVEIVHDSQGAGTGGAMQDDQIWLEVMYLGTSGVPLGTWISDAKADVLAPAADQASSSATWTGDAAGWDTQKLSVTMTPQEKGVIVARVVMGVASKTAYVDPNVTVT